MMTVEELKVKYILVFNLSTANLIKIIIEKNENFKIWLKRLNIKWNFEKLKIMGKEARRKTKN